MFFVYVLDIIKKMVQKYFKTRFGRPPFSTRDFLANFCYFLMVFFDSPKIPKMLRIAKIPAMPGRWSN